ncbi:F0F1 ATP synthase subunit B [Bombilactobacillus folatiphilus]|uniref:ATP synthase subunit b n=1 Tax=Bombilactobacillus folatiphilus TaxID=2923362 RepID=A0ABY4PAN8_9LACO|nr:F0F1 ATP synthase subunit B [Bombilactobacillus folatiphilus]UQS82672.1 F0F1 ATP synthase subunit B [Bombilactobacillus folatiphilus]
MQPELLLAAHSSSLGDSLFVLVSFLLLLLLVKHFAWGPITKMMDQRVDKITGDLDYADNERKEAEQLKQKRASALKDSKAEAVQIVADAKKSGEDQRSTIVDQAHTEAQDIHQRAQADAKQAKVDAMKSVQHDVAQLSVDIATQIIGRELSVSDQQDLIDSYIKELNPSHETK